VPTFARQAALDDAASRRAPENRASPVSRLATPAPARIVRAKEDNAMHCFRPAALCAALLLAAAAGPADAQATRSDSVVKASAKADKPDADGNQTVTVTLDVEKPWHLYANPVGNDMLTAAQTSVRVLGKVEDVKLDYPAGKVVKDETVGDYKVYEGAVTIKARVKRARGDAAPLELSVKFQACDDKSCLIPATVKLTAR
jgi:DsbC/DsbD-like thiol-disulfide interchange protein